MNVTFLSPQDRRLVQGMTAPSLLVHVDQAFCPDPTAAVARLDITDAHSWDRVMDGSLGEISGITSEVLSYGTVYSFYLRHNWDVGDLDMFGVYDFQFKLTFATGEIGLYPQHPKMVAIERRAGSATPIAAQANVTQEVRVEGAHTFVLGDVIYPTGPGVWALASTSDFSTLGSAVVSYVEDAMAFWYTGPGALITFPTDQGWAEAGGLYLDPDNDGKTTQVQPTYLTHSGEWLQTLGSADSNRIWSFQHYQSRRL